MCRRGDCCFALAVQGGARDGVFTIGNVRGSEVAHKVWSKDASGVFELESVIGVNIATIVVANCTVGERGAPAVTTSFRLPRADEPCHGDDVLVS